MNEIPLARTHDYTGTGVEINETWYVRVSGPDALTGYKLVSRKGVGCYDNRRAAEIAADRATQDRQEEKDRQVKRR